MTVTTKVLVPAKEAENAQTSQYVASNCKAVIDKMTVTNTTGGAVTFACNLVTLAGSPGAGNLILSKTIPANSTYTCPELVGHSLDQGGFISTIAGAANSLTIRVSGREIT